MNREIKFRAKSMSNSEWVYGNYIHSKRFEGWGNEFRIHNSDTGLESDVDINSVGQFSGLLDADKKEIYEGDILKHKDPKGHSSKKWEVIFYSGAFFMAALPNKIRIYNLGDRLNIIKVIGNIHENPELLKLG